MSKSADLLYEHLSYKDYLRTLEAKKILVSKGFRSRVAVAAQCNTPFVSHVLNGHAHFSLEQAHGISQLLGLGEDDTAFFLLLVQLERAGTAALKQIFRGQIETILEKRQNLRTRLKGRDRLSLEDKIRYYSTWEYAALHVIVTISTFQTPSEMAKRLNLPEFRVRQMLEHLSEMGLVNQERDRFIATTKQIYLGQDSDLIAQHHTNWRVRTLPSLASTTPTDLHYSSVITISRGDAKKLRARITDLIAEVTPLINESKEEEIYSFCLDLFNL